MGETTPDSNSMAQTTNETLKDTTTTKMVQETEKVPNNSNKNNNINRNRGHKNRNKNSNNNNNKPKNVNSNETPNSIDNLNTNNTNNNDKNKNDVNDISNNNNNSNNVRKNRNRNRNRNKNKNNSNDDKDHSTKDAITPKDNVNDNGNNNSIASENNNNASKSRNRNRRRRAKEKHQRQKEKVLLISNSEEEEESEDDEGEAADLIGQNVNDNSVIHLPVQPILVMCPFTDCKQEDSPFMNPIDLQSHLGRCHRLNINNIEHVVPFLEKYLNHWIDKIEKSKNKVENFGIKMKNTNIFSIPNKSYQKEDISIRQNLQREKLNEMLMIQDRERKDNNKPRKCLFCKKIVNERINYFQHMFTEHNFNIGLPDNIVNIDEFLYILQTKLNGLQCLYCEKIFKSNAVLRKHMRKKKHFKINSKNHIYDKFYIINYLEPGKNWENFVNDKYESDDEKDDEWDDWDDEVENEPTMCLFDEYVAESIEEALNHMKNEHHFDFYEIQKKNGLDFYQCIMLINYIRRQTSLLKCFSCGKGFEDISELGQHLEDQKHYTVIPSKDQENGWNDVKYMLPTYDDDPLLHGFDEFFDDLSDTEQKDISTQYVTAEKLAIDDRLKEKTKQQHCEKN